VELDLFAVTDRVTPAVALVTEKHEVELDLYVLRDGSLFDLESCGAPVGHRY